MIKDDMADSGSIAPDDLAMLQRVFNEALPGTGYAPDSLEARLLASRVIHLYLRGIRDEVHLRNMLLAA